MPGFLSDSRLYMQDSEEQDEDEEEDEPLRAGSVAGSEGGSASQGSERLTRQQRFVFDKFYDQLPQEVRDKYKEVKDSRERGIPIKTYPTQHRHVIIMSLNMCRLLRIPGKQEKMNDIIRTVIPKDVTYAGKPFDKAMYMHSFEHQDFNREILCCMSLLYKQ
jgi:hypothetical protein